MMPVVAPGAVADRVADGIYEDHLAVVRSQQVAPVIVGVLNDSFSLDVQKGTHVSLRLFYYLL